MITKMTVALAWGLFLFGSGLALAVTPEPTAGADRPKEVRLITGLDQGQWLQPVVFSPDGTVVAGAVVNPNQGIRLWNAISGKELHKMEVLPGNDSVSAFAFSPDGKLLAVLSQPQMEVGVAEVGQVRPGNRNALPPNPAPRPKKPKKPPVVKNDPVTIAIFRTATGKEVVRVPGHGCSSQHGGNSLCFSPDGKGVAAFDADGFIRLWDAATGKELFRLKARDKEGEQLESMVFSPDGKMLASALSHTVFGRQALGGGDNPPGAVQGKGGRPEQSYGVLILWEIAETGGKEVFRHRQEKILSPAAFSLDGKTLCCRCEDSINLWDVAARQETRVLKKAFAHHLACSPSGKVLVSTADAAVRLWETASGKQIGQFQPHIDKTNPGLASAHSQAQAVLFLADDKTFLTAGARGAIKRWDLNDLPPNVPNEKLFQPDGETVPLEPPREFRR